LVGKLNFREIGKEQLIDIWVKIAKKYKLQIKTQERMEKIEQDGDSFIITTIKGRYRSKAILLAIGRRGTPRKLGVPGEELPKVVYRLIDSQQYRGKKVLIVGGGDSALEAAHTIADESGASVTLSYRSGSFSRAKPKNRNKVLQAQHDGKLSVLLNSNVKNITTTHVEIDQEGSQIMLENDAVIISAGGILPTPMLKEIGIQIETKFGTE
jgi:thioredoxin reductase